MKCRNEEQHVTNRTTPFLSVLNGVRANINSDTYKTHGELAVQPQIASVISPYTPDIESRNSMLASVRPETGEFPIRTPVTMILSIRSLSFLFDFYLFKFVLLMCSIDDFIFALLGLQTPLRMLTTGILWTNLLAYSCSYVDFKRQNNARL